MPPENHRGKHEGDEYDDLINQNRAPTRLYSWYFRRHHNQTRSEPEVVDDYSEETQYKTTTEYWRRSAYHPSSCQRSMLPRQGGGKTEQEMSSGESLVEYLEWKQRNGVALKENQGVSEIAAGVEAAWRGFTCDMKPPLF